MDARQPDDLGLMVMAISALSVFTATAASLLESEALMWFAAGVGAIAVLIVAFGLPCVGNDVLLNKGGDMRECDACGSCVPDNGLHECVLPPVEVVYSEPYEAPPDEYEEWTDEDFGPTAGDLVEWEDGVAVLGNTRLRVWSCESEGGWHWQAREIAPALRIGRDWFCRQAGPSWAATEREARDMAVRVAIKWQWKDGDIHTPQGKRRS